MFFSFPWPTWRMILKHCWSVWSCAMRFWRSCPSLKESVQPLMKSFNLWYVGIQNNLTSWVNVKILYDALALFILYLVCFFFCVDFYNCLLKTISSTSKWHLYFATWNRILFLFKNVNVFHEEICRLVVVCWFFHFPEWSAPFYLKTNIY